MYRWECNITSRPLTSNNILQHRFHTTLMSRAILHVSVRRACRDVCLSSVRATRCTPANARARSWGKFAQQPTDLDFAHLSPRLRAAIQKKNEEKLAFQYVEPPVKVFREVQTVTTDEELRELAHLQPTSADLEEWRAFAVRNGEHEEAYNISTLFVDRPESSILQDPNATTAELDWQFRDMLATSRQAARLAGEGNLRPFDDPLDGAVSIAFFQDRVQLRYEAYNESTRIVQGVMNFTLAALINIVKRRRHRSDQLARLLTSLHNKESGVRQLMMEIIVLLPTIKRVLQNHHLIIGRNTLLVDEQIARMQGWKQNINPISRGWERLIDQIDTIRGSELGELIKADELRQWVLYMLLQTRTIKVKLKQLRILYIGHDIRAIVEARHYHDFLHPYFSNKAGVRNSSTLLRKVYQHGIRKNLPCSDLGHSMDKIHRKYVVSDLSLYINMLDRCLYFIQTSRVSKQHRYQEWSADTPEPVLPNYVRKAVERHRKQYGSQSIY